MVAGPLQIAKSRHGGRDRQRNNRICLALDAMKCGIVTEGARSLYHTANTTTAFCVPCDCNDTNWRTTETKEMERAKTCMLIALSGQQQMVGGQVVLQVFSTLQGEGAQQSTETRRWLTWSI